ncbi:MAG: phage antirepressor KilAC domain-containing protein [Bacteroides sp.]|nr:phage antirepressor KilAC domain-containing protein [Bacteroides sp.]
MNEITIFQNQEFGAIRTCVMNGETYFVGLDVAIALGYAKPRNAIALHVDEDDALKQGLTDSLGRSQQAIFINESGLYSLILSSKLEGAKRFKRWVTSEVLPSIRKQGGYMNARQGETDTEIMQRAIKIVQTTIEKRDKQIAALKPRAAYADEVLDSISCITTTQLAKELSMSTQELNRRLCEMRIQYWQSGQYMLYAGYARQGFAKSRTHKRTLKHGIVMTEMYLVWTERGRDFVHQLFDKKLAN